MILYTGFTISMRPNEESLKAHRRMDISSFVVYPKKDLLFGTWTLFVVDLSLSHTIRICNSRCHLISFKIPICWILNGKAVFLIFIRNLSVVELFLFACVFNSCALVDQITIITTTTFVSTV